MHNSVMVVRDDDDAFGWLSRAIDNKVKILKVKEFRIMSKCHDGTIPCRLQASVSGLQTEVDITLAAAVF